METKYLDLHFRIPFLKFKQSGRWVAKLLPTPGNVIFTILIVVTLFWAQRAGAINLLASSSSSISTIAYQGRLANKDGSPVTATLPMVFRLYNIQAGGTELWREEWINSNSVMVSDGLFNVMLGSLTPINQAALASNGSLWLGVSVGTDGEMTPRVQLGSVPYAFQALTVPDGAIGAAQIANGSITTEKLDFSIPRLLGYKTCDGCANVTSTLVAGWNPVKGATTQENIETTVTTDGGPVLVEVTMRRSTTPSMAGYCYIRILKDGQNYRGAHIEGLPSLLNDWACSGSYLFIDLPAGTYTFQALVWADVGSATWQFERQIVVFQY